MPRYIDADALISKLAYHRDGLSRSNVTAVSVLNNVIEIIERRPTVSPDDARGVGKWLIDEQEVGGINGERQVIRIPYCSNCGTPNEWNTNYCPNCGAKMEVE